MSIWRFQVSPRVGQADPLGRQVRRTLRDFGVTSIDQVRTARLYLIDLKGDGTEARDRARRIAEEWLTDPVVEVCAWSCGDAPLPGADDALAVEVYYKPGVLDSVAESTACALAEAGLGVGAVRTARRYEFRPIPADRDRARLPRLLANACIEEVFLGGRPVEAFPAPAPYRFKPVRVPLCDLDDAGLGMLSRDAHLFLSIDEMRAIRHHFSAAGREPTDLELETLAQTWSEHCVHKTLRSAIDYRGAPFPAARGRSPEPGAPAESDVRVYYENLLADTIARATRELIAEGRGPECLSVFEDNAGVIGFDARDGIAFKVETHNHPSAIEPYGGAATGVGGVIRDVIGCGLGARPIANTDVFCVAPPDWPVDDLPRGVIHPRTVLKGVVAGVRDYGNRMGIPTVNGAVHVDPRYLGNPLVYCGCVGLIPRDRIEKAARPGDAIVLAGGRTGRDGIHGATFSSAELTEGHEEEFAHAVQIGNPIEEKKLLDFVLRARDAGSAEPGRPEGAPDSSPDSTARCLFSAITDCGAGGLSSAIGEMAARTGAEVFLERVPLKYAGLKYDEIWISEAQERMVLAVPPEYVEALLALARSEAVEATVIGRFTDTRRLVVRYGDAVVGDLDMAFLHDGRPRARRVAEWRPAGAREGPGDRSPARPSDSGRPDRAKTPVELLKQHLSRPDVASKHWIIRQYDHEVQGGSVIKPLVGPRDGPSDAAVIRPKPDSRRGIALGCGMAPHVEDPYWMAVAAIDEALRNVVCVGGDPGQTAILDNFCWPAADDPHALGALVRACQGCYDAARAYGLPFISGKDSLNNVFSMSEADAARVRGVIDARYPESSAAFAEQQRRHPGRLAIPGSLLISAVARVEDVSRCPDMSFKQGGSQFYLIGQPCVLGSNPRGTRPGFDMALAARTHHGVARLIRDGLAVAVHDVSDGGLLTACAEMCIASGRSCLIHGLGDWGEPEDAVSRSESLRGGSDEDEIAFYFLESPGLYIVESRKERHGEFVRAVSGIPSLLLGTLAESEPSPDGVFEFETPSCGMSPARIALSELAEAWKQPLDW